MCLLIETSSFQKLLKLYEKFDVVKNTKMKSLQLAKLISESLVRATACFFYFKNYAKKHYIMLQL